MGSGGGGSTTTTVDPLYNAGMLALSVEQQEWAEEMYNMFQYGVTYDPEEVQYGTYIDGEWVSADELGQSEYAHEYFVENPEWQAWSQAQQQFLANEGTAGPMGGVPSGIQASTTYEDWLEQNPEPEQTIPNQDMLESQTLGELHGYDPDAQTSELEYLQNLVESNQALLGLQTQASASQLESQIGGLEAERELGGLKKEVAESFLKESMEGLDVGEAMDSAQAGVQHGFKKADEATRKSISQYGLDPSSGRFATMNRERMLAESAGISGARNKAKQETERENYARKMAGAGLNIVGQGYYSDSTASQTGTPGSSAVAKTKAGGLQMEGGIASNNASVRSSPKTAPPSLTMPTQGQKRPSLVLPKEGQNRPTNNLGYGSDKKNIAATSALIKDKNSQAPNLPYGDDKKTLHL